MAEQFDRDELVVLLGTPNPDSTRTYALTVTEGDPSWAGALAGVDLRLPVYHIMEQEIKAEIDPQVYEEQVAFTEMVLDVGDIARAVREVRERAN